MKRNKDFTKYKEDIITKELIKIETILNGHIGIYMQTEATFNREDLQKLIPIA